MKSVFIDGQFGTTGLQIYDRIKKRNDIELLEISEDERKNSQVKQQLLNTADLVILCLPDQAAKEAISLIENSQVKILDASTAHRVAEGWAYGLPELSGQYRNRIRQNYFVANPGCYPTGFLLAITPLIQNGIVPEDYPVTCNAVSGYSGGGKKLIDKYESRVQKVSHENLWHYRPYALQLQHKHLPEMTRYSGLLYPPLFVPSVGHFYQGMLVFIPLSHHSLSKSVNSETIYQTLIDHYHQEKFIRIRGVNDLSSLEEGFLSPLRRNQTNVVEIFVYGNHEQTLLISCLDNLGKGASGAAVQNMNLMLGFSEQTGLL